MEPNRDDRKAEKTFEKTRNGVSYFVWENFETS